MAKVKSNVTRLSSATLVKTGRIVVTMMTGNPVYPAQQVLLPALAAACDELNAFNLEVTFNGGKLVHTRRRGSEDVLRALITDMASHVQIASGGDIEKIYSAGFNVRKNPEPTHVPAAPQGLQRIFTEMEGTIKLRWTRERNALMHRVEMLNAEGVWQEVTVTTRSSYIVAGLVPGQLYSFRVRAINTAGTGPVSQTIVVRAA